MSDAEEQARGLGQGEIWSLFRVLLSQGCDIQQDYDAGKYPTYEHYSARVDEAARERTDKFMPLLTAALHARERAVLDDVLVYATMRGSLADSAKHVEHLAGNIVKEAREDGALAELHGLEQWCRQHAQEVGP